MHATSEHTPFGLRSEENPHPTPSHFEKHEKEQTAFGFGKPCEAGQHAPQPRESEHKICDDDVVVQPIGVEVAMPSQTVWMVSVAALSGEEGQIPILDHIPPEGVGRVDKREYEPGNVREAASNPPQKLTRDA